MAGNTTLGSSTGAYVAAVGLADDVDTFVRIVTARLFDYDFEVVDIEDIETFDRRSDRFKVDPEVTIMAASLNTDTSIALATFHAYKE